MHGDVDDSAQDGEDSIMCIHALLKFDVLVPKGMGQEVESNASCTSFKKPESTASA
jgi:hypothetical protein